jgi:hypothetical protein
MMGHMEEADRKHVGEVLRELSAVHRVTYNALVEKAYWAALKDMSIADFDHAAAHLRKYSEWMPKPAHFWAEAKKGWM